MALRVGIIGTGSIADNGHAPAVQLLNGMTLSAVLSRDKIRWIEFLKRHASEEATVYTSLIDFSTDPDIDLVIVCSPDSLHAHHAKSCLLAGKHVLLEKPIATDIDDAKEICNLAQEKWLILATGFHLRSHVGHRLLQEKINQNEIGTLRHIRSIWAFPQVDNSNWRAKKELTKWWSLSAVGSHCLDLVRWFTQDNLDWTTFTSITSNEKWNGPHDETAIISWKLSSGVTIEVVSSVQFWPFSRLELFGDLGFAVCDNTLGREGGWDIYINNIKMPFKKTNPFLEQLKNVMKSIEEGEDLNANADDGLRGVKDLLQAINKESK